MEQDTTSPERLAELEALLRIADLTCRLAERGVGDPDALCAIRRAALRRLEARASQLEDRP